MTELRSSPDWHLEKSVSIGHIVTTVTVALTALWWAAGIENRISLQENSVTFISQKIELADKRMEVLRIEGDMKILDHKKEVDAKLGRIEDKLDKLISYAYSHDRSTTERK